MITKTPLEGVRTPVHRRLGHRPELDGIRGIAIVAVMVLHTSAFFAPGSVRSSRIYSGFLGVDLFFVLSGFLITTLLLEEQDRFGAISLSRFYGRRALRILPALAFGVALAGIATATYGSNLNSRSFPASAVMVFGFVANWSERSLGFLGHMWSLGVEEQYYLAWPIILIVCLRRGVRLERIAAGLLAAAAFVATARWAFLHGSHTAELLDGIRRTDAIMLGSALAVALAAGIEPVLRLVMHRRTVYCAAAAVCAYVVYVEVQGRLGHEDLAKDLLFVANAGFALLLGTISLGGIPSVVHGLRTRTLTVVGRLSYSLYLVHYPLFNALARVGPSNRVAAAILGWTGSFALAFVSFRVIERPALRLKGRLFAPAAPALLDGESVRRRSDAGLEVQRRRGEEELVGAV